MNPRPRDRAHIVKNVAGLHTDIALNELAGVRIVQRQAGNKNEIVGAHHARQWHARLSRRVDPILHGGTAMISFFMVDFLSVRRTDADRVACSNEY